MNYIIVWRFNGQLVTEKYTNLSDGLARLAMHHRFGRVDATLHILGV